MVMPTEATTFHTSVFDDVLPGALCSYGRSPRATVQILELLEIGVRTPLQEDRQPLAQEHAQTEAEVADRQLVRVVEAAELRDPPLERGACASRRRRPPRRRPTGRCSVLNIENLP